MSDAFDRVATEAAEHPYIGPKTCTVQFALNRLTEDMRLKAARLIDDIDVDPEKVADALRKESGVPQVDESKIRRHRNRLRKGMTSCKCPA